MGAQLQSVNLYCRINPPSLHLLPAGPDKVNMLGLYPPVEKDGWCGQYKPMAGLRN
jgi:hypothetical protein